MNFLAIAFLFLVFHCPSLFSASALFHVVIAEKWLNVFENYNEEQKQAFILGTLFPDIRYTAEIPRYKTHEKGVSLELLKTTQDPFLKGMRLHVLVDEIRDRFVNKSEILQEFRVKGDRTLFLKLLEDEILYSSRSENSSLYLDKYLQNVVAEEERFNIPIKVIQEWHALHRDYFRERPSELYAKLKARGLGFGKISEQKVSQAYKILKDYAENQDFQEYVHAALLEFDQLFKQESFSALK